MSQPNNAVNVSVDSDLTFTISDNYTGVDWTTFAIQLTGDLGYSKTYTDADTSVVTKTGTSASYDVTVNPDVDFGIGEIITVTVTVDDLASPAHSMIQPPWSFKTAISGTGTLILHPSGLASTYHTAFYSKLNGSWATVLDSNDGDGSYAYKCCGPGIDWFSFDTDDPVGLSGATIDSVTIYAYARYLSGAWPDAIPIAGTVSIGYKTGTSIVWKAVATDDSGNYNLVVSDTHTVDSDGGALGLDDIMNLQTVIKRSTGGPSLVRVTEVYVVVQYTFP
jgi:hypothetical protein